MTAKNHSGDVLVIGAGIAGASAASALAGAGAKVILAEMEPQPGYHTTGRSAATFVNSYGNDVIRALNAYSRPVLEGLDTAFSDHPILSPRGALFVAGVRQLDDLQAALDDPPNAGLLERLEAAEALELSPALRPETVAGAAYEPAAQDIDVNALLMGYLKRFRAAAGALVTGAEITGLLRRAGAWEAETRAGRLSAPVLVNAAGAWGDEIAYLAGARPVGLVPKRRTALTFDPGRPIADWPLTISLDETWYFRPEAGDLLVSPADETPSPPCDSQPEEIDVALCVDRIQSVTTLEISRLVSKRAGLRTFVHDKSPVAGFADDVDGFFWLVGQGGYGIQTAPAMARITAALIDGGGMPRELAERGATEAALGPGRLQEGAL
ncbi:MAG: FAD-binding oxidoreductase [Magnetovibrio sp.]|nr:FAD-binding oxidoreductase [Magnetovibrio sp.]